MIARLLTEYLLPIYALMAMATCLLGTIWQLSRYAWARLTMRREIGPRPTTPYPIRSSSWIKAFLTVNLYAYIRFWWRANPVTFVGHVLYHGGLFLGLGTYGLVIVVAAKKLIAMPLSQAIRWVADWFQYREEIFGTTGWLASLAAVINAVFIFALVIAVIGMTIPFVMTILGRRGMTRPLDEVITRAGISETRGLKTRGSLLGFQRKVVGLIVLVMDSAMLLTFVAPMTVEVTYIIHVLFALTITALLPYSFLFHEIYRLRMWGAVVRIKEGRTA